ncbi:MAG: hypothetical protein Kow00124_06860 [Anaerolineae bacterium]
MTRRFEIILILIILAAAGALRFTALDAVPPGLTHDEADHGLDAAGVLDGIRPVYFTVGYGREPLYDYSTALVMLLVGRSYLAGRITAALYGMALLLLVYGWVVRAAQNRRLALATIAALAVSFWAVSVSRHALRTITLPTLYMAAALAMWKGISVREKASDARLASLSRPQAEIERWIWFVIAGVFLGGTLYTYLAARIMWVVFPAFFIFMSISQPRTIRRVWPGLLIMLATAAVVAAPLIGYLLSNPGVEVRIGQLSGPLDALLAGDPGPLLSNVRAGLGMLTRRGDDLWLYSIPGTPLLGPIMGLLFYLGISIAALSLVMPYRPARRGRRSYDEAFRISGANAFMMLTLGAGLVPALITGVGASSTRVIGMLPALYYFPALAVTWLADWAERQVGDSGRTAIEAAYAVVILVVGVLTIRSYFVVWNNAPDVRVAYHTTLVETIDYLDSHPEIGPHAALSSIAPGPYHDPAVAAMRMQRHDLTLRWFDGRSALLFPGSQPAVLFFPEFAMPDPVFADLLAQHTTPAGRIELRPTDKNQVVQIVTLHTLPEQAASSPLASIDGLLSLLGYELPQGRQVHPGEAIDLLTFWRVEGSTDGEIVLFTHVLSETGQLVAQQDLLSVPAASWVQGDLFVQLHRITLPANLAPGTYSLSGGAYTRPDIARLPLVTLDGESAGDHIILDTIEVLEP